jgi:hypothetical protein
MASGALLRSEECSACGVCVPFLACLVAADAQLARALGSVNPWAVAADDEACACTTTGLSGIRAVDLLGCRAATSGAEAWCYVAGGVRCASATPSMTLVGAATKPCDAALDAASQCRPGEYVWLLALVDWYGQQMVGMFEATISRLGSACQRCARQAVAAGTGTAAIRSCIPSLRVDALASASAAAVRFIQASADSAVSFHVGAAGAAPKTVLDGSVGTFGAAAVVPYTLVPLLPAASGGLAVTITALSGELERGRSGLGGGGGTHQCLSLVRARCQCGKRAALPWACRVVLTGEQAAQHLTCTYSETPSQTVGPAQPISAAVLRQRALHTPPAVRARSQPLCSCSRVTRPTGARAAPTCC